MCGFTCSGNDWCAFQGSSCNCGQMCEICANLIEDSILDAKTSRCLRKGGKPAAITPDFHFSVECLKMCYHEPRPVDHGCPYEDCCSWGKGSGVKCENGEVVELHFREDLALAKKSPVLNGSFPEFIHKLNKLKVIRFIGGQLSGTLSASLGFVDHVPLTYHLGLFCQHNKPDPPTDCLTNSRNCKSLA